MKNAPDDKTFRECIEAVCQYVFDATEPQGLGFASKMFFDLVRPTIDAKARARENGKKGAEYGKLGGNPNFAKGKRNPYYDNPKDNPKDNPHITAPITPIMDIGIGNRDNGIGEKESKDRKKGAGAPSLFENSESEISPKSKFVPPTLEQLQSFISENSLNVDAGAFIDHYVSVGWKVGKSTMKDWKAAARNWHRRNQPAPATAKPQCNPNSALGVEEYIRADGKRTYGTGRFVIPDTAPPRPSERHIWNASNNQWILI